MMEITGTKELLNVLEKVGPRNARNLMRSTVHAVAGEIAKKARSNAPKGVTGNLKKSIKTKRKKSHPSAPVSEVIIKGKKVDAFYWRFVEKGTKHSKSHPFIRPAVDDVNAEFTALMIKHFGKKLEQAMKREAKRARK